MKNIYLFFLILGVIGCDSNSLSRFSTNPTECPSILFAKEHKKYIGTHSSTISLDNISYNVVINNASFSNGCQKKDDMFYSKLSILFISSPLLNTGNEISFPIYIALIDSKNNVLDKQYYLVKSFFKENEESKNLMETEIIETILISNV